MLWSQMQNLYYIDKNYTDDNTYFMYILGRHVLQVLTEFSLKYSFETLAIVRVLPHVIIHLHQRGPQIPKSYIV